MSNPYSVCARFYAMNAPNDYQWQSLQGGAALLLRMLADVADVSDYDGSNPYQYCLAKLKEYGRNELTDAIESDWCRVLLS